MLNKLYSKFFGYRLGQVVYLNDFDRVKWVVNNANFKAFDAIKGKFGYWVVLNSDINRYVIARKYKI